MNMNQKKLRAKQGQSKNMVIVELMELTGWSRDRVIASLSYLEATRMIKFPEQGGIMLRAGEVK